VGAVVRRKVSNPLALAVMSYLTTGPMHRYDLVRTLQANGDSRSVKFTPASVYMVVDQLAKAGFIEEHETLRTGGYPERITFVLTAEGRDEWRTWLRSLIADPEHEYPQFVLALSLLAALPPDDAVGLLEERRRRLAAIRDQAGGAMQATLAAGLHPLFLVDEEFRLALIAAEVDFIDRLIARITEPASGWAAPWAAHLDQTHSEKREDRDASS
jgi:DNA-binding PadR family transcriptional regulator